MAAVPTWPGVIEHYRAFLPVTAQTHVVTLLTGHGLKDPDAPLARVGEVVRVLASIEKLAEYLRVA